MRQQAQISDYRLVTPETRHVPNCSLMRARKPNAQNCLRLSDRLRVSNSLCNLVRSRRFVTGNGKMVVMPEVEEVEKQNADRTERN